MPRLRKFQIELFTNCIRVAKNINDLNKFYFRMIHKILEDGCDSNSGDVPQKPEAVIIAPTRELAIQIKVIY